MRPPRWWTRVSRPAREQIASALDVVIQVSRFSDGKRRLTSLQEVTGMEGDIVTMQEIFKFERQGIDEDGAVIGTLTATGIRPSFGEKLRLAGSELPAEMVQPRLGVEARWSCRSG